MKRTKSELIAFKVKQGLGSMAIEGVRVPQRIQHDMMRVASGRASGSAIKAKLIAKYRQGSTVES